MRTGYMNYTLACDSERSFSCTGDWLLDHERLWSREERRSLFQFDSILRIRGSASAEPAIDFARRERRPNHAWSPVYICQLIWPGENRSCRYGAAS